MSRKRAVDMGIAITVLAVLGAVAGIATFLVNLVVEGEIAMREGWEK